MTMGTAGSKEATLPRIAVQVCTRNPRASVFAKVLDALRAQTLPANEWQLVVVDNVSTNGVIESFDYAAFPNARILREERPGTPYARLTGFRECRAPIMMLIDDDNVAAPDYLEVALRKMEEHPIVGVLGGSVEGVFEEPPPEWFGRFTRLMALRDEPEEDLVSEEYRAGEFLPLFTPPGAGMVVRLEAARHWMDAMEKRTADRPAYRHPGTSEDNDIMLCAMKAGWRIAHVRRLHLEHHICPSRLTRKRMGDFLDKCARDWLLMCREHDLYPRPPVPPFTVPFLKARMWFRMKAWQSDTMHLAWRAYCGEARGRGMLKRWP